MRRILFAAAVLVLAIGIGGYLRFAALVHALGERRATGPSWSFPSRVYSDDLPLVAGMPLPPWYLRAHLELRGYTPDRLPLSTPGSWAARPGGVEILLRGFAHQGDPRGSGGPERIRLALANGRLSRVERLGGLRDAPPPDLAHPPRLEPERIALLYDSSHVRREWIPLARIPRVVRNAVIAGEDRRFYKHVGFDVRSNLRALVTNVRAGGLRQGGSTITQQLARGLFLSRERTLGRKLAELPLAAGLEIVLSKEEILEMYLNAVYWGQDGAGGVAGVAEAARFYFDQPVEELDLDQAALLAGLIPAPNAYTPFRSPRLAKKQRDRVLDDMVAAGFVTAAEAAAAKRRELRVRRGKAPIERHPSFLGYVRDDLARRLPARAAESWGLSIFTTLDLAWQPDAEAALAAGVEDLERWRGRGPVRLEGAFVAIEPSTGFVRAVVGGRVPRAGDFNRATQARRQPGSAMKPVVYAAALDPTRGAPRFTPASVVPDLRRDFDTPEGKWAPRNDEGDYHDEVTLAKALAKSLNIATANLVEAIGAGAVARYAERFGLGRMKAVPSMGLGTNEVTLLALTDAYAAFPNGGVRREPCPIRAVVDGRGRVLLEAPRGATRVLPDQTAALMTGLLEDVVIFGVSYPLRKKYGFMRPVAGKTGTTNDYNDAWFVGFTPDVVAGVWVGFDAPESLRRPAAETALPVWARIMTRLLDGFPPTPFRARDDLVLGWIDPWSGGIAGPNCPSIMRVPFVKGEAPRVACRRDHTADWAALAARQLRDSTDAARADSIREANADSSDTRESP